MTPSHKSYPENALAAYAAGLIDGEANVGIYPRRHRGSGYKIAIHIDMTSWETLHFLQLSFGGSLNKRKLKAPGFKEAWTWYLCHRQALALAKLVIPYAICKAPDLQKIIDHYAAIDCKSGAVCIA